MKIKEAVKHSLAEIGHGQTEVLFAYVNPNTGDTITPFCKCKDFFNDMFWSRKTGTTISIYGFSWDKTCDNKSLDGDTLMIAIKLQNKGDHKDILITDEQMQNVLEILYLIEEPNKFEPTEGELCNDGKYLVLKYDRKWSDIPYLNSALYFFVRLGFTYNPSKTIEEQYKDQKNFISPNDAMYYRSANQRVKDLLAGKIDNRQKYEDYNTGTIHNNSGLVYYKDYKI